MGQCGCGEYQPDRQYSIRGCVVGIQVYDGCDYCHDGLVVDPYFFAKGSDFIDDQFCPTIPVTPDQYGGTLDTPLAFEIFSVADLREAAKECHAVIDPNNEEAYESVDEWLEDNGLRLIQTAVRKCRKRQTEKRTNPRQKGTEQGQ